jgi:selenocysteine-specific elongation factor
MPIVATAGHVDHGKSTLILSLTGRDPDRWTEEKERGLTIDLGFAWTSIGGHEVGFVDVPGHERFIKNMLAGVGAVDVALFVVAADEGWKPQSEEHLAVLDLLETRHGVVALTRIDLCSPDQIDLSELEVIENVAGTALEGWPVVRVSPVTGAGIEALRDELGAQLDAAGAPPDVGRPRLWVDRAFHITGAGLVVTGTLTGGTVGEGDELYMWPEAVPVRVRGVQRHDQPVREVGPGTRTALNLTGVDRSDVTRGAMLGHRDHFRATTAAVAAIRPVRSLDEPVTSRGAFHLHCGSGSWPIRLRLLDAAELVAAGTALLRLDEPVPLQIGDRFVVREVGRRAVVAGGVILDPAPPDSGAAMRRTARLVGAVITEGPDAIATALLAGRGQASLAALAKDSAGGDPLSEVRSGDLVVDGAVATRLVERIQEAVDAFHRANRLRPGMPKATLVSNLALDPGVVDLLIATSGSLVDDGATVRTAAFSSGLSAAEEEAWQAARAALAVSLAVPRASQLGLAPDLLHALLRSGRLVKVAEDLVYLPEQLAAITGRLGEFRDGFSVGDFRDAFGMSRRQAVPLLEWLDGEGWTRREGDGRVLKRRPESGDARPR